MHREVLSVFEDDPGVRFAFLFGSQAGGRVGPLSDHDFAVYLSALDPGARFRQGLHLAGLVSSALGTSAVDVVVLNDATPELAYTVLRDGKLFFFRDRHEVTRYHVRTALAYLDREPMRRIYNRYLAARLREGEFGVRR